MATPTELSVLLRLYSSKQNSPSIVVTDLCDYLQKYSRHYLQDAPDLVMYLDDTNNFVGEELEKLEMQGKVQISSDPKGRKLVFVPQFFVDKIVQRYRELDEHPEIPFTLSAELPSGFPSAFLKPIHITTDFTPLLETTERTNALLIQLIFPDDTPPIAYPAALSPEKMLDLALGKIRLFLRKDEAKDYVQKRMMVANPGKELTIKNQLIQLQTRPSESYRAMKHSGEAFLFWSYLCSFIRQDYAKKNEKTPEEKALIQAVFIAEYLNNYYKNKAQQNIQRETALKNLELSFQKPPYYFDMESITRFTDSRGVPLLGQYKDADLENFIKEKTNETALASLPALLVFKTEVNNRYFVLKEKVLPLVLKLSNDARKIVKEKITQDWYRILKDFRQDEAMKSSLEFEKKIIALCREYTPIVYSILNASFIPLLALEGNTATPDGQGSFTLFDHGKLVSYSTLLMLNRQELITDTKIMLPFWYTIPVISAIFALFRRPKQVKNSKKHTTSKIHNDSQAEQGKENSPSGRDRKAELKQAALNLEKKIIPQGSTLENEIATQLDLWNRTLDPQIKENLTEDVNSLARDYIRRIIKTLKASTFDLNRIENLSKTLVDSPGLIKIKNRDALLEYIKLYIVRIIRNLSQ